MGRTVWGLLALITWSVSIPWALAQTAEEIAQEPFRGLNGVGVLVDAVKPEGQKAGLISSEVEAQVERRLREAGVRVLTRAEAVETPGMPYLYVYVDTTKTDAGSYAYVVRVSLNQGVALDRDSAIKVHTETWNSGNVGAVAAEKLQQVGKAIDAKVDEFITAYHSANPSAARESSPVAEEPKPQPAERVEQQESPQPQERGEKQESLKPQPTVETLERGEQQESPKPQTQVETQGGAEPQVNSETHEDVATEDGSPKESRRGLRSSGPRAGNAPRR